MKRVVLIFLALMVFTGTAFAATPKPTLKVFLFYKVSDAILQCQNDNEDMIAGGEELEKELINHYNKRFVVQGIKRVPLDFKGQPSDYVERYSNDVKTWQKPLLVIIELKGQGQSTDFYQNAYGAKSAGVSPTVNVQLIEAIADTSEAYDGGSIDVEAFYSFDYGVKSYGYGTFSVGRSIFAAQTDARKNTKGAVRGVFRDACKLNESINKYADPVAYEQEYNRFTGNFKASYIAYKLKYGANLERIEKFKEWCNAEESRKQYLSPVAVAPNVEFVIVYIDNLIKAGVYKE